VPHEIKQHDTLPVLRSQVVDDNGLPVNLTGATLVRFTMRLYGATTLAVNANAALDDAANGWVKYVWQAADTAAARLYSGEFEITLPAGKMTFPRGAPLRVLIRPDLNNT